jgi:flagella basal body P-ring formation protein FlgA
MIARRQFCFRQNGSSMNFSAPREGALRRFFLAWKLAFVFICLAGGLVNLLRADEPAVAQINAPNTRVLTEADALTLLTSTLQKNYVKDKGELELNFTQPWTAPVLPDEPLTVKILELPTVGVTPSFIIRFQLCTTNETVGTWQATVQAHVWREVWVAHSDLQRGELVSDADVARDRRDVLGIYESLAEFSTDDSSLELANQVQAGGILLARNLKPRAVVHRGQIADALLEDGALSIMMKVEVLEDGAPGQIVRARNPVSLRNLSGKVIDEKTILISL